MNSNESSPARAACPRCGSGTSNAFGFEGLCLRCAGVRVLEMESGTPWEVPEEERPLERIGPYEIIEELGHGGMGRVFATRQPGLGRIVAVKSIREGMDPELDMRFLREIQTIARLRHPNIVVVHDSGRSNGSLYFSMDYIEGGDLAARLRVEVVQPREAAYLMSKVADALSYSHNQGVLHRDLKPSNILLDGKEPKLADFGLASQIDPGGDLTAVTRILGTPHYLAPEALFGGSAAQSVASDIYSVGVILFEMLTGRTPFAGASTAELPALLKDSEPPPVRLLAPGVPRDLETICLKCLDREPTRRYATAGDLTDDLRRFLDGRPIVARPASTLYRVLQFGRRHRLAMAASALVALTLVVATAFSLWFAARAQRAERRAAAESETSKAIEAFLEHDLLEQADPDAQPDRDIKLSTVVERAAAKVDGSFKDQPAVELGIRATLAKTYEGLEDFKSEKPQIDRAVELATQLYGAADERTLDFVVQDGVALSRTGHPEEAEKLLSRAADQLERKVGPSARPTLSARTNQAYVLAQLGKHEDAEKVLKGVIVLAVPALGAEDRVTIDAKSNLSSMYFWESRYAEAEPLNEEVMRYYSKKLGPENPVSLISMANLAAVYVYEDKIPKAREIDEKLYEIQRRKLGSEHPETLRMENNLGSVYRLDAQLGKGLEMSSLSYNGRVKAFGSNSPEALMSQGNLVWNLLESGRRDEAIALGSSGLEAARKALGTGHPATQGLLGALSEVQRRAGNLTAAEALRTELVDLRMKRGGPRSFATLQVINGLAQVEVELGKFSEAENLLRPALVSWKETQPGNWHAQVCRNLMGAALSGEGRYPEAEPLLVSSSEELERLKPEMPRIELREVTQAQLRTAAFYKAWGKAEQAQDWTAKAGAP